MTRQAVGRVSQRAPRIWLCMPHRTVPDVVLLVAMSRATVRGWMGRFKAPGPAGLSEAPRRGRPRKRSPQVVEARRTRRQDDPRPAGSLAPCGTVVMLGVALVQRRGVRRSVSTRRGARRGRGLRGGRPRLTRPVKTDPAPAGKPGVLAKAVLAAGPEAAIWSAAASRGQLLPVVRALGHGVGQHLRLPPPWHHCPAGPVGGAAYPDRAVGIGGP